MAAGMGAFLVIVAGFLVGTSAWPIKVFRKIEFEHWWFMAMLVGLVIIPWTGTLVLCKHPFEAYRSVQTAVFVKANLCALAWGLANVLSGICLYRIGTALTGSIVAGLGAVVGVTLPLIVKGSGLFRNAPDITSKAGLVVLAGVAVMLIGVVLVAVAGFGRDKVSGTGKHAGGFVLSLILCVISGLTACGLSLAFVYGQGPIVAAMKARGASNIASELAVWAGVVGGGALFNLAVPCYMMTKKRSWGMLIQHWPETCLAVLTGTQFMLGVMLMGRGMVLLGALGASVGFGIQQATQMMGNQSVGFISGEWRGVQGRPKSLMLIAMGILIIAAAIMAYGNTL